MRATIALLAALLLAGCQRYDVVPNGHVDDNALQYAWRVDRWTGQVCLISSNAATVLVTCPTD